MYLCKYLLSRGKIGLCIWFSVQNTRIIGRLLCSLFGVTSVADIMYLIIISVYICLLYISGSYFCVLSFLLYTEESLDCIGISFCLSFFSPLFFLSSLLYSYSGIAPHILYLCFSFCLLSGSNFPLLFSHLLSSRLV
jgi:hypothetical protein